MGTVCSVPRAYTSTSIPTHASSPRLQLTCTLEGSFLLEQWLWSSSASAMTTNLQTSLPSTFCNYTFFNEIRTPTSERGLICHACPYSWACALSALGSHIMFPCIWELLFYHSLFILFNECLNHCVFCLLIGLWMMQSQSMFAVVQKENAISIPYRTVSWPTAHCHVY